MPDGLVENQFADLTALATAVDGGRPLPSIVFLAVPDGEGSIPAAAHAAVHAVRSELVAWAQDERFAASRLIVVTRDAVAVAAESGVPGLAQSAVWGLVRAAQAEHPGRIVIADVDDVAGASPESWAALSGSDEPQLALRGGTVLTPRLTRAEAAATAEPLPLDSNGTVLITGGTGALGGVIARHLVTAHDARRLLLLSRGGDSSPGAAALVADLTALGAEVTVAACDSSDRAALTAVLDNVPAAHPLTAVIHAAGVLDDGALGTLTPERVDAVLRPKIDAAWHLHDLLQAASEPVPLVLFSSAAGTLGGAGQSAYAAANAFLDALAAHRTALGLPTVALAWGAWQLESGGMAAALDAPTRRRMRRSGMLPLTADDGLTLFDLALGTVTGPGPTKQPAALVPVRLDPAVLRAADDTLPPLLLALAGGAGGAPGSGGPPTAAGRAAAAAAAAGLRARLAGLAGDDRQAALLAFVRGEVAEVLGHADPAAVGPDRAFNEQGFDSLTAVELRNRLNAATGQRLPATLVFDHPTARALARLLDETLPRDDVPPSAPALSALDRLADALAGIAPDHPDHARIDRRLRAVAAAWAERAADGTPANVSSPADGDSRLELESADDDAVFDFITNELGIS